MCEMRERERLSHLFLFFFFSFSAHFSLFFFPSTFGFSLLFFFIFRFLHGMGQALFIPLFIFYSFLSSTIFYSFFYYLFSIIILLSFSYLESGPKLCIPFFFFENMFKNRGEKWITTTTLSLQYLWYKYIGN
jgi:hypothetical protein